MVLRHPGNLRFCLFRFYLITNQMSQIVMQWMVEWLMNSEIYVKQLLYLSVKKYSCICLKDMINAEISGRFVLNAEIWTQEQISRNATPDWYPMDNKYVTGQLMCVTFDCFSRRSVFKYVSCSASFCSINKTARPPEVFSSKRQGVSWEA
jgi:hypothetical protein